MTHGRIDALTVAAVGVVVLVVAAYVVLAGLRAVEPPGWGRWRTVAFVTGGAALVAGLAPGWAPYGHGDLRTHMLQHLLIGMYAPLGLVLGAPVTLALRSLPHAVARRLGRALGSRTVGTLAHPVVGLVLTAGGLVVLHTTSLHGLATRDPVVHHLVHAHFLVAGCLFAYAVAGADPAPHRPSVPHRLVVVGVAVAVHAGLSQVMYAGLLPHVGGPTDQVRGAAELMYYGGDVAELLLALALVTTWRPVRSRRGTAMRTPPGPGDGSGVRAPGLAHWNGRSTRVQETRTPDGQ